MPELGDSIFEVMQQGEQSQAFRTSMGQALQKTPEVAAQNQKVAKQLGTHPSFVESDPQGMAKTAKVQGFDYDSYIKKAPRLAAWASVPENAEVAADDMPVLANVETAFQRAKRIEENRVRFENYRRGTSVGKGLTSSFVRGVDQLIAAPTEVQEAMLNATVGRLFGPDAVKKVRSTAAKISPMEATLQGIGKWAKGKADILAKEDERETESLLISDPKTGETFMNWGSVNPLTGGGLENIAKLTASEAGPMAAQIGVTMATGGATAPALAGTGSKLAKLSGQILKYAKSPASMIEVSRTVSGQYEQGVADQMAKGLSEDEAKIKVAPGTLLAGVFSAAAGAPMEGKIIEDLLEKVAKAPGGKTLVRRIAGRLTSAATTAGKEGTQEVMNGIGEDLAEWITYNPDKTIKEAAANAVMNFVGGAAMGGTTGFAMHSSQDTREFLRGVESIADTKLAGLDPDKAVDVINTMAQGGQENVYVDAQRFFQTVTDAGLDPVATAQEWGIANLEEAAAAGTDIVVPVGSWAIKLAPEIKTALAPDVRLSMGDMTEREEQEAADVQESLTTEAEQEASAMQAESDLDELPSPAIEDFRTKRAADLEAAGYAPETASNLADFHARFFETMAGGEGLTVEQMDQLFPLEISAYREGDAKRSLTDVVLERLQSAGNAVKSLFQSAFHGSPYRFDKFSLEHMGKGEGAQAYGWGLYFAGSKDVAEWYRVNLSAKENEVIFHGKSGLNQTIGDSGREGIAKRFITTNEGNIDKALAELKSGMESFPNDASFRQAYEWLERNRERVEYRPKDTGQTYEVDIPDDGSYLLWDKPLSEQPEAVRKAFRENGISKNYMLDLEDTGEDIYRAISRSLPSDEAKTVNGDQGASKLLHGAGIAGIKYLDGSSRADGEGSYNYVVFDDSAVKIMKTFYQNDRQKRARAKNLRALSPSGQGAELNRRADEIRGMEEEFAAFDGAVKEIQAGDVLSDKKGFLQFGPDRKFHIGLLEKRDLSTFLHESGHYFLEVMFDLSEREGASDRVKTLQADTLKWLGVESRDQVKTEHHEKFARAMEAYLYEGKAPSEKMRPMMQRFRAWLMLVYKRLSELGVTLNDEVRGVFDRMLATDAEIEANRPKVELFTSAEDMGVSQKEFEVYVQARRSAIEQGRDKLTKEILDDLRREQSAAYKAELEKVKEEVSAGVDSRPDIKAVAVLKDPGNEIKLNRSMLKEQFGDDAKGLPTVENGGFDAETVAELMGFENGAALVKALKDAPNRDKLVNGLAREIMLARYGDKALDGSLGDAAVDALHNERKADVIAMEMRHLNRLKGTTDKAQRVREGEDKAAQREAAKGLPSIANVRQAARTFAANMTLRDLTPRKYLLAEERARREAQKAKNAKDYQAAVEFKSKELLNHFLYLEAMNARAEGEKIQAKAKKATKPPFQSMLGKAGKAFQDAYNRLLADYEFADVSGLKLDERAAELFKLQQAHESAGIDIDPALLALFPRNFRMLKLSEIRAVAEAMENIEHVARETQKAIVGKDKADLDEVAAGLVRRALQSNEAKPLGRAGSTVGTLEKKHRSLKGWDAYAKQMVRILDDLDGGDANGEWHKAIWQPISDAMGEERKLGGAILKRIDQIIKERGELSKKYLDTSIGITLPGETVPLNRREAIGFLANLGTEENRNAMLGGYGLIQGDGSLNPMVFEILGTLTKQEALFVQDIWNVMESMWPAIEEQERKLKGLVPTKKTNTPFSFTTRDGETVTMMGGYFPLVGEPLDKTGKRQMSGDLSQLVETGYTPATTSRSHTKEVSGATYRVNLDFGSVISRHLPAVIKDITHRQAVLSINRILNRAEVSRVIQETLGPEYEAEFMPWLKATVNNRNAGPQEGGPLLQWIMKRRHGMAIATLGANLSSTLIQLADVGKVLTEVNPIALSKAWVALIQNPKQTIAMIRDLSPNRMRDFEAHYHRDLMQYFENKDVFEKAKGKIADKAMIGFQLMGQFSAFPAWLASYQSGMSKHGDQERAVREADVTVDRVIQLGDPANLSRVMREKGAMQLLTTFQSDLNIWYNVLSDAVGRKKAGRVAGVILAFYLSAMIGNLIVGRGPKDDEEWEKWIAQKMIVGPFELIPLGGDFAKALYSGATGESPWNQNYSNPVFNALISKPSKAVGEVAKEIKEGDNETDAAFAVLDAVGTWMGFPGTAQILKSSKYLNRVNEGEEQPDNAGDVAMGVAFGKRK